MSGHGRAGPDRRGEPSGGVAVVTDSTADLPLALAEERGLRVVPMSVAFGSEVAISGVTISVETFYERLAEARELPTTSQPAPAWFEEAYGDCADAGAGAVVSIHLSSKLSGTVELARRMAERAALPVEVVDSRQVSGGLALMALTAQRTAAEGGDAAAVAAAARAVGRSLRSMVVVDSLDYLRRGGRLTGTEALLGSVLRVKPMLGLVDGRIEMLARSRTWRRARQQLVERAVEHVGSTPAHVMITHALAPERAGELLAELEEVVDVADSLTAPIGPVIGTHTGPGAVALALCPAPDG